MAPEEPEVAFPNGMAGDLGGVLAGTQNAEADLSKRPGAVILGTL